MIELSFQSDLNISREALWTTVSTMRGVNAELRPLLRMTWPRRLNDYNLNEAPTGEVLFRSRLLLFGLLPVDLHSLILKEVRPGEGFVEESFSWTNRFWRHERTLEALDPGRCRLRDRLTFAPRLAPLRPLLRAFVNILFTHRHSVLRKRFG
ncbi:MAG TPA: hypothetical protein PK961_00260 [bacterium]|nr:hypothetical protein [bacterium]